MASIPDLSPFASGAGHVVGRVAALWRYPVKSMGAEALDEVEVSWHGVAGDRRWAFIRDGQARSGFPWLTMRQRPELCRYRPSFLEPDLPDASPTVVRTPAGAQFEVLDPALAPQLGEGVRAIKQNRGIFDTMPLSLITTRTVAGLGALVGDELDVLRFRPNLLIDAADTDAFPEDEWVGCTLRLGGLRMRVDKRDKRCVMVNIDPVTAHRDPAILRTIARERQSCLGVYGSTVQPGRVAVGDPVVIDTRDRDVPEPTPSRRARSGAINPMVPEVY
jgi:MOSC domain-containing protein